MKHMIKLLTMVTVISVLSVSFVLADHPPVATKFGGHILPEIDKMEVFDGTTRDLGLAGACDRIVETMCMAECGGMGIPWPLPPCPAPDVVPGNTMGPCGMGLLYGYTYTGDPSHLVGVLEFGEYATCYSYGTGEPRFATGTPHFLWYISDVFPHSPMFRDYAEVEFFEALANGTYGTGPHSTSSYLQAIASARSGTFINMRPYEMSDLLKCSTILGDSNQVDEIACWTMMDGIDQLDNNEGWNVLGPACGVFGLASANLDYDPQAGAWAATSNLYELMDALLAFQHPTGGGFVYDATLVPPFAEGDQDMQPTAYAVLAMKALDPWVYADEIAAAEAWIWDMQLPNGGFLTYLGGAENIQVDGEALWALLYEPEPLNDGDVDDNFMHTPQDSQQAFMITLGIIPDPTWRQYSSADCNGDGTVTAADPQCIWEQYLGTGECACVDDIVFPPACFKKSVAQKPVQQMASGQLVANVESHDGTATITINLNKAVNPVDSFGFVVEVPTSWTLSNSTFSKSISSWNAADAVQADNRIVVGAWNVGQEMTDGQLITLTFDVKPGLTTNNISITNLVDDIDNFNVIMR